MDKIMDNPNMWHIRDQIFDPLNHETVLICRQVCQFWNESLARMSFLKLLQEFGDRDVVGTNEKLSTIVAGWNKAAKMFVAQASLEELQEVKVSLLRLARGTGKCCKYPVHEAAKIGAVKLMEFILRTSFDMNAKSDDGSDGRTAWHWACWYGKTETAQLLIQFSKDLGIDLNTKNNTGGTAWHDACYNGQTETAQIIIQYSKEFGIDLNAKNNDERTAWHCACAFGKTETAQLIIQSSKEFGIDLSAKDDIGRTAWHLACCFGKTGTAQLLILSSKEFGIDLSAKDDIGRTGLHLACINGTAETVQMILKNWKDFGIDMKAQDNQGKTALDLTNRHPLINLYQGGSWRKLDF